MNRLPDAVGEAIVEWADSNDSLSRAEFDRRNAALLRAVGDPANHTDYEHTHQLRRADAQAAGQFAHKHDVALAELDETVEYVDLLGYAVDDGFVPVLVCLAGDIEDVAKRQHELFHRLDDTSPCDCQLVTDGGVPLRERVERYRDRHPDAGVPTIAGALEVPPSEVAEVLGQETTSTTTGDHVSGETAPTLSGVWQDSDFTDPNSGVWPDEQLEREQWMGHVDKKPFAPWGERDHADADPDEDARWKWGITDNYVDGDTIAMAEVDPRLDGRAFLQQPDDPYVYVDGDDVRDPETGEVHPAFVAILEHLGLTYADISQSGAGVHAIYRGDLPEGVKQAAWQLDDDPWGSNDDLPSIEVYPGKRVCVMTGDHVPGTPCDVREWNDDVIDALLEANDAVATSQRAQAREEISTDRNEYDLADHEPAATTSAETTDDIRDLFYAIDRLDAQRVADRTIVHRWNDEASTSDGERAFAPIWGPSANGTANIVNDKRWMDTGDRGGYGGPVVMAAIDAGEIRPEEAAGGVSGQTWWRGIEHLRELGFNIPEYNPPTPTADSMAGGTPPDPKTCAPPTAEFEDFDRERRWRHLKGRRYDDYIDNSGPTIWGDHAGAGKTTNAGIAAANRDRPFAILFDKHEKAREFVLDDATPEIDFHLKGGEQKRHEQCMDADHADERCPEHPGGGCPHMCPIYDLDTDDPERQRYEAVVEEVGPVQAHMILDDLPDHDDGKCAWIEQFNKIEGAGRVVGVHEYQLLKTVRDGRDIIIDESPGSLTTEREVDVEGLARTANVLDALADTPSTPEGLDEFARFSRDIMDAITGDTTADALAELNPPEVDAETYYEEVDPDNLPDDVSSDAVEQRTVREDVGMPKEGYVNRDRYVVERTMLAEALAQIKLGYNEHIVTRIRNDEWNGAPLCVDTLLAAAIEAGIDSTAGRKAIAVPTTLSHCPWCGGDLDAQNGALFCTDSGCGWHEHEHTITQKNGETARALAWLDLDEGATLNYAALPLASNLPSDPLVLDATATPAKVAALYDIPREQVTVDGDEHLESNLHTTQVIDGQYHAGTIRQAVEEDRTLAKRVQRTIDTVADLHRKPLYIGPKSLLDQFSFPDHGETLHYHAARGLNRSECDAVVCIGAPHANLEDLERQAELLGQGQTDVRVGGDEFSTRQETEPPVWRKLLYEDDNGDGRAIPTKDFSGLVGDLWRETREKELVQGVHRIRPLLAEQTKHAYLLTNVPTEVSVDELATFEELADPLEALLPVPEGGIDLLESVHDVVNGEGPDGFRAEDLVEHRDDGTIANKVDGYHRLAQLSGLDVSQRTVYNWVHALEDVGLLTPEAYEQQAGVSYAVDFATLKAALSVLTSNDGFKVAAKRRLRSLLSESGSGLDWLAWATDVFTLSGDAGRVGGTASRRLNRT